MARPRKEGVDYYPHYTYSLSDPTLDGIRTEFGNDGYAIYYLLREILCDAQVSPGCCFDFSELPRWRWLVSKMLVSEQKLLDIFQAFIDYGVMDAGLFREKKIWFSDLIESLETLWAKRDGGKPQKPALTGVSAAEIGVSGAGTRVSGVETGVYGAETRVYGAEIRAYGTETEIYRMEVGVPAPETGVSGAETGVWGAETRVSGAETGVSGAETKTAAQKPSPSDPGQDAAEGFRAETGVSGAETGVYGAETRVSGAETLHKVKVKVKDNTSHALSPRAREGDEPPSFEVFARRYPKNNGYSRAALLWAETAPDETECEKIMRGLEEYMATESWKEQNGRYAPAMDTFLRDRLWEKPPPRQLESGGFDGIIAELEAQER
jgi:hypothetical protein